MKYQKARFTITDVNGHNINDSVLLQTSKDILCSIAGEAGFESFEETVNGVDGYVQKKLLDRNILDEKISYFPIENIKISYGVYDIEDKNWNEKWEEKGFSPIFIKGKCVIHDMAHPVASDDRTGFIDITIDAKQTFGTGNHETTYMIVDELLGMDLTDKTILDCGCGTGILSIAAAKLGAKCITGYDIDEWCVKNTLHNSRINDVGNIEVLHGDISALYDTKKTYDVILANINRNILLADMVSIKQKMDKNAVLILSGFYIHDANMLIQKAQSINLRIVKSKNRNRWCMLKFQC